MGMRALPALYDISARFTPLSKIQIFIIAQTLSTGERDSITYCVTEFCVFFLCFSSHVVDYISCVAIVFVVLDLVSSILRQEIGWEERLWNDLFWVKRDVKPCISQLVTDRPSHVPFHRRWLSISGCCYWYLKLFVSLRHFGILYISLQCTSADLPLLSRDCSSISRVLQSLWIPAIWLYHHPHRGVDSVRLQILLVGTCRQCGSWSVAGHNHRKVIGWDPISFVQVCTTWTLTCLETVQRRLVPAQWH